MAQIKDGPRKDQATVTFRQGSRGTSETEVCEERSPAKVVYSRCQDVGISCVPASLANLLAEKDPDFALELANGTRMEMFSSLRQFTGWLMIASCFLQKPVPYQLLNCLPVDIRSQSVRDVASRGSSSFERRARQRLDWVLAQQDGDFMVTVIASDGQASHFIGVSAGRRLIFDHEDPMSLPFNTTGFDAA
jgi:hypothetical protein